MSTVDIDPLTDAWWLELVSRRPTSVFHSPRWLRVLSDVYGFPFRAHVLMGGGTPVAGIAYAEIRDFLDPRINSLPFSDFCDPIADTPSEWRTLAEPLLARCERIDLRCLHNSVPVDDDRFATRDRALWHSVDVTRDEDTIWEQLPGSARRALRKAGSEGVHVRITDDVRDLRSFFELHVGVRKRKYGLLAQPWEFFERIFEHFIAPGHGTLILATVDDRVIGGCVFLEWQDVLYYKFNASDPSGLSARPNDRVLWEGIRYARKRGLSMLDFGLSDADQEGLVRYKRKYATEERDVVLLRHLPEGRPTARDREGRRVLRTMTDLLTDDAVPDEISEAGGAALYRYFI